MRTSSARGREDAIASHSDEETHPALDVNIPGYANAGVPADEVVGAVAANAPSWTSVVVMA